MRPSEIGCLRAVYRIMMGNKNKRLGYFAKLVPSLGILCVSMMGCLGPDVKPDEQQQSQQELSLAKEEVNILQAENKTLSETNQKIAEEAKEKEVKLAELGSHTQKQQDAIKERERIIDLMKSKLALQKKAIEEEKRREHERKVMAAKKEVAKQTPKPQAQPKGKYHLRIISLPARERYEKYVKKLQTELTGDKIQHVVARKSGNYWVVDIGYFSSHKAPEAVALKNKMQSYSYEGVPQFRDCLYVKY